MSYGISIVNRGSATIIDSDLSIFYCIDDSDISISSGTTLSSSFANGQLIFVRPPNNTSSIITYNLWNTFGSTTGALISSAGSANIRKFESITDGVQAGRFSVPTTGYGINVYNGSGSPVFSGTSTKFGINFDIIAAGSWPNPSGFYTASTTWIPMSKPEHALSNNKTYILLNTCQSINGYAETSGYQIFREYEFDYTRGAFGEIGLRSYRRIVVSTDPDTGEYEYGYATNQTNTDYIIGYIRG